MDVIGDCPGKQELAVNADLFVVSKDILWLVSEAFKCSLGENPRSDRFSINIQYNNYETVRAFLQYLHYQKSLGESDNINIACLYELIMSLKVKKPIYDTISLIVMKNISSENIFAIIRLASMYKDEKFLEKMIDKVKQTDYLLINEALKNYDKTNIKDLGKNTIEILKNLYDFQEEAIKHYNIENKYEIYSGISRNQAIYRKKINQLLEYKIKSSLISNSSQNIVFVNQQKAKTFNFHDLNDSMKSFTCMGFQYDAGALINDIFYFLNSREFDSKFVTSLYKIPIKTIQKAEAYEIAPLAKHLSNSELIPVQFQSVNLLYAYGGPDQNDKNFNPFTRNIFQKFSFYDNIWYILPSFSNQKYPCGFQIDSFLYMFDAKPYNIEIKLERFSMLDEEAGWEKIQANNFDNSVDKEFYINQSKIAHIGEGRIMIFSERCGYSQNIFCNFIKINKNLTFEYEMETQNIDKLCTKFEKQSCEVIKSGKFIMGCNKSHIHKFSILKRKWVS